VLLPTSLTQHSHSYLRHGFLNSRTTLSLTQHICIGTNSETITSGEMLDTPTQCHTFVIYDDAGQKTRLNSINSTLFEKNKHHYRKLKKKLIGSCTDLNIDSGSNLKYWLRFLLQRTPVGVHSVIPAPWSSLLCQPSNRIAQ